MKLFLYKTFARVALMPYIGGTVIHFLRLSGIIIFMEFPYEVDWVICIIGGYALFGFILNIKKINFISLADKIFYGLVIFHLGISVVLHAYSLIVVNHNWMLVFPMWYSFIAMGYFIGLGIYCFVLGNRISKSLAAHQSNNA